MAHLCSIPLAKWLCLVRCGRVSFIFIIGCDCKCHLWESDAVKDHDDDDEAHTAQSRAIDTFCFYCVHHILGGAG